MKKENIIITLLLISLVLNIILTIFTAKTNKKIDAINSEIKEIKNELNYETIEEFYENKTYDEARDEVYDEEIYVKDEE